MQLAGTLGAKTLKPVSLSLKTNKQILHRSCPDFVRTKFYAFLSSDEEAMLPGSQPSVSASQRKWSGAVCVFVCVWVCTQLLAAALRDAVAVHFAEVPEVEADPVRMQRHAAQTSQSALWWYAKVTRRVALQRPTGRDINPHVDVFHDRFQHQETRQIS